MTEVATRLLEQLLDVLHRLLGLGPRITETDQLTIEVGADLAAHINGVTGHHRLAKIVIERLVRISVTGVEHPDTLVGRHIRQPAARVRPPRHR